MIVVVTMFGSMAMGMFVTMTMPMTMLDAVGMDVIMFMVLTMLMIVAVIVLAVAMTMARAIGMHMIVGIAAHGDFLAGLKIEDCRPGLVPTSAMSTHQATSCSSSMLLMFSSSPCNRLN